MSRPQKIRDRDNQYSRVIGHKMEDKMAGVDLEAEYELVMAKTSKLTAKQRRYVVAYHDHVAQAAEKGK